MLFAEFMCMSVDVLSFNNYTPNLVLKNALILLKKSIRQNDTNQ